MKYSILILFYLGLNFPSFAHSSLDKPMEWNDWVKTGWCVYSTQSYDTSHISMIEKHEPGIIRWFVEWDRFDTYKKGKSLRSLNLDRCRPFFKICAKKNTTIVIAMWVKERFWEGDMYGGTQWAKQGKLYNYPAQTDKSYGSFVRDLIKVMKEEGMTEENIIAEGWNEPDLLWGLKENIANYHSPWKVMDKKGFNKWTGGSGEKWKALFSVLDSTNKDVRWANGCVGLHLKHDSWVKPSYEIENISIIDLHYYLWQSKTAEQYCDSVVKIIERYDSQLPEGKDPLKIFIGEINRVSSGTTEQQTISSDDAKIMREACKILFRKYGQRFIGITAHGPIQMWKKSVWYLEEY